MLVSVVLPFTGNCPGLETAVRSILEDGWSSLELVLVDNGADAPTRLTADRLAQSEPRILLLEEPMPGIARALNHGIRHCQGTYVARMDADDRSLPGRLRFQSDHLNRHPEIGLVSGQVRFTGTGNIPDEGYRTYVEQINRITTPESIYHFRFVESPFAHPSVMFRRSVWETLGGYSEDPSVPEDYELWLRWMSHGVRMAKVPEAVLEWNDSPGRLSRTGSAYSKAAFDKVRMSYLLDWLKSHPILAPVWIWGAGKLARKKARFLSDAGIAVSGFIEVDPLQQSIYFNGTTLPVMHFQEVPPPGDLFIVSLVSNRGRPFEIEAYLTRKGYQNEVDFVLGA